MRVVVVGAGVVGLAVSRALLRRGCEVTCLEAAAPMAARSAGSSRLLRTMVTSSEPIWSLDWAGPLWCEWDTEFRTLFARRRNTTRHELSGLVRPHRHGLVITTPYRGDKATIERHKRWPSGPTDGRAGVIDAAATGRYLRSAVGASLRVERVDRIEAAADRVTVWSDAGRHDADHVVIAAGQGTAELAAQVGIETPSALAHQVQFTFGLRYREDQPPCWLDRSHYWQPGVTFSLYPNGDDRLTIGVEFGDGLPWDTGRDEAVAHSLETVRAYARDLLPGVGREVLETVHGTVIPGLGDGVHTGQNGPATAIWGNNLFMCAPAIGHAIADALHDGATPGSLIEVPPR